MAATRRLANAIIKQSPGSNSLLRTGMVVEPQTPADGRVDVEILSGQGTLILSGVRFIGAAVPQVGRQVTFLMNGTEPVVLGESGTVHQPVIEGDVFPTGFTLDGEDILAAWSATSTESDALGGGTWEVRSRRIGTAVLFTAVGTIDAAMAIDGTELDLPLPYEAVTRTSFAGHMGATTGRQEPVTGYVVEGESNVKRIFGTWAGNDGFFGPTTPTVAAGWLLHLSGTYETG